jgi:hypothetical protein
VRGALFGEFDSDEEWLRHGVACELEAGLKWRGKGVAPSLCGVSVLGRPMDEREG